MAEAINSAPKGQAHSVALKLISQLPADIRELVGADLEEMAIVFDYPEERRDDGNTQSETVRASK